ncbi:hypothetical protein HOY80DRAFT_1110772 [Tuber brumale]|nr:hypothetical protein HOY80DRAFT_1110772 [Tuber brumale]
MIMSHNAHGGMSRHYMPTTTPFSPSLSEGGGAIPRNPNVSALSEALPDSGPAQSGPPVLTCPVPICSLVFKGEMSHGYLWRHLRRPGIYRRTGDEKASWLLLHKIEHDLLVATGITPEQRKREANRVRAQKVTRAARFERRAWNVGVIEERLVAQKVAIWEGMYAAKQSGDGIAVSILYFLYFLGDRSGAIANRKKNSLKYDAWVLLDLCTAS